MFWSFTALLVISLFWMERGDLNKMDLTGGIVFGENVGFRFAKNIRSEYIYAITKQEENERKLERVIQEIGLARADSTKYELYPRNPEKVKTATNKIRSQVARKVILESRLDSLKVSPTVNGTRIPVG